MAKQLERFQRWLSDGSYRALPAMRQLGIRLVAVAEGEAVFELDTNERHLGPQFVHGGVLCTIADVAMATALVTTLDVGVSMTTVELKINFLRPTPADNTITATGRVVKEGRTLSLVECRLTDRDGNLLGHATSTCMTLRPAANGNR